MVESRRVGINRDVVGSPDKSGWSHFLKPNLFKGFFKTDPEGLGWSHFDFNCRAKFPPAGVGASRFFRNRR
jgi:hypothetical protein